MPTVDKERNVLVVRVVYDGPPMSGKTTTLRTLAKGLGVSITSPHEQDGRTLFFDWVDYVGGIFEGRQIRCQILSVPGQKELGSRRRRLLESADALVMVADTRAGEINQAFDQLRELLPWCRSHDPPVGVVVQANKRDAPDAVPRSLIHEEFARIAPIAVVDTVATSGDGVREAFVFGVRLALDRVRALAAARRLQEGGPEIDSAAELLEQLTPLAVSPIETDLDVAERVVERPSFPELEHLAPYRRTTPDSLQQEANGDEERIFVPDPLMPGGFIWPPVDGRTLLYEVSHLERTPVRTRCGDWWASGQGWRFHSASSSLFGSADLGRQELIEWARLHASNLHRLSPGRTVILADAGGGRFRLWQLVRVAHAIRERLVTCAAEARPPELARELQNAAYHLVRARRAFHGSDVCLPCTLWTVSGDFQRQPMFVGLMPKPGDDRVEEATGTDLVAREFVPLLKQLASERADYPKVVDALARNQTNGQSDLSERLFELASARDRPCLSRPKTSPGLAFLDPRDAAEPPPFAELSGSLPGYDS